MWIDALPHIALILVGFLALIQGARYLLEGAAALAAKYELSEVTLGLSLVAMGTSLPELAVSLFAQQAGEPGMVLQTILGSSLVNLLGISGGIGLLTTVIVQRGTLLREVPFALLTSAALFVLLNEELLFGAEQNALNLYDSFFLLLLFLLFLLDMSRHRPENNELVVQQVQQLKRRRLLFDLGFGLLLLACGGYMAVDETLHLTAHFKGNASRFAALLLVPGACLPEAIAVYTALKRNRPDLAVGNVIGANIFNLGLMLPLSSLWHPMPYPTYFNTELLLLIGGNLLFFFAMFTGRFNRLNRLEGGLMLGLLLLYYGFVLFVRG